MDGDQRHRHMILSPDDPSMHYDTEFHEHDECNLPYSLGLPPSCMSSSHFACHISRYSPEEWLSNFHNISDLSFLPQHIRIDLFLINSKAWRVTRKILKLVVATGKEEILSIIQAHNNILPIRYSGKLL
ncbi:unnamed protein product [Lactuca virosa]|uniref:Uncharacterized protein n=1 Tax=Lactuca virosa TaxID=75947 RepID=A0AAU9MX39_9ASTR|nr:unnamed protein product [Lactuca virosa]